MSEIHKLSKRHEEDWADWLGCERNRGSGNQWNRQADGRLSSVGRRFGWAFDCKAAMALTKSIGVTRAMLAKIVEQAHGERPLLPLRFYASDHGAIAEDWVLVRAIDFLELLEVANGD